jgi:hypothetical protein
VKYPRRIHRVIQAAMYVAITLLLFPGQQALAQSTSDPSHNGVISFG